MSVPVVLAAVAHPDDVEFSMAGTLLLLKSAGAEIHLWNLANGCLGTTCHDRAEIARIRWEEARASAAVAGAAAYPPLFEDLAIFYDAASIARVSAVIREIKPTIVLTQPTVDYMEDHQNAGRLVVTAVFSRGMKNQVTVPVRPAYDGPAAVYHCLPHGLRGPLGQMPVPTHFVGIERVLAKKREMLARHRSQKEWLDASQGFDAYLDDMERLGREVGRRSGRFAVAEGFTQHLHLGFAAEGWDPLSELLGAEVCRPSKISD